MNTRIPLSYAKICKLLGGAQAPIFLKYLKSIDSGEFIPLLLYGSDEYAKGLVRQTVHFILERAVVFTCIDRGEFADLLRIFVPSRKPIKVIDENDLPSEAELKRDRDQMIQFLKEQ